MFNYGDGTNSTSNPVLTNVTFSGNQAGNRGGGMYNDGLIGTSSPVLTNTVLWGNIATNGPQIYNDYDTSITLDYSLVEGGESGIEDSDEAPFSTGTGNLSADPYFVTPITATAAPTTAGNYRLQAGSPAIDSGNNDALATGVTTDPDGVPRIVGGAVDLGAYEAHPDVTLRKTVTPTQDVAYHGAVTYTLTLSNSGTYTDTALLTDTLPTSTTFAAWVISPTGTLHVGDTVTWTGALSIGHALTWTFRATHTGSYLDVVTNTAHVSGSVQTASAADAFTVEVPPDLRLVKTVTPTQDVAYHGAVTYTVVLSNAGITSDPRVVLTDTLPTSTTFAAWVISPTGTLRAGDTISWTGALTAGHALTWTFVTTHTGDYLETVTNTVYVSGTGQARSASAGFTVEPEPPNLHLVKSVAPTADVAYHGVATYTVTLSNLGDLADSNVRFTDTLPTEVDFAAWVISPTGTLLAGDTLTWQGALAAGQTITWMWTVNHTGSYADAVYNTATCSGTLQAQQAQASFRVEELAASPIQLYVDADAAPGGNGLTWGTAYPYLQDALDRANANGATDYEIWVADGVYYPDEGAGHADNSESEYFTLSYNNVQLYGGFAGTETAREQRDWDTHVTILSGDIDANDWNTDTNNIAETWNDIVGNNADHVLYLDGVTNEPITETTVIDGFTITGGQADGSDPHNDGGGLYCDGSSNGSECSSVLTHIIFSGNQATIYGGGMYSSGDRGTSCSVLSHVTFTGNYADSAGGGMFNSAYHDGTSSPILTNVTFNGNQAAGGGGMCNFGMFGGTTSPVLTHVIFSGNTADVGGGMSNAGFLGCISNPMLTNVTFIGNQASHGGGMHNWGVDYSEGNGSSPVLTNITFSGNVADAGGGIYNKGEHNGISAPVLNNVILWGNSAITGTQLYNENATPVLSYTLIQSGANAIANYTSTVTYGPGILTVDPRFIAPITATAAPTTAGNYRLQPGSPAIDAGDSAVTATTDLDGIPRIVGGAVDLGAYEAHPDVTLRKTVTPTQDVAYHGAVTYTFTLSNSGTYTDTALLTDTLPTSTTFAAWVISPTGTLRAGNSITWTGALSIGHALTWTLRAAHTGTPLETVVNTAHISGSVQSGSAAAAFAVSTPATLRLTQTVTPTRVLPGAPITYTLAFSNAGGSPALGVVITETLPISVTHTHVISTSDATITPRGGARYVWDVAKLAPGAGGTFTITGILTSDATVGTLLNTATITAPDSVLSQNVATTTFDVALISGVALTPHHSRRVLPGSVSRYTHILTNTGNGPDTFDLTHHNTLGWTVDYATPVALGYGQSTPVVISVTVPGAALSGTVQTTLSATSQADGGVSDSITDTTHVALVGSAIVSPTRRSVVAFPGTAVGYAHTLTNTANTTQTFTLAATSSQAYPVTVIPTPTVTLPPWHGATPVTVTVHIPTTAFTGTVDHVQLTAAGTVTGHVRVTDTTTVVDEPIIGVHAFNDGPTSLGQTTTLSTLLKAGTHVSYMWDFGDGSGPVNTYASPSGMGLSIPDNGCGSGTYLEHSINVPTWAYILDIDVKVSDLRHAWDDDVNLYLRAPDGTQVALSTGNGGMGDNYYNTIFDDEAPTAITAGTPPFTGRFRPEDALSTFDGLNQQGDWTLRICDGGGSIEGVFNAWELTIMSTTPDADGIITHTYAARGTYTAQVTARNSVGTAMTSTVVTVIAPITSANLTLLNGGAIYTDTQVSFSADLSPDNADKPYTYTVDYGDGTGAMQAISSADPLPLTHTFATTGTHQVVISAWNADMAQPVTATVSVGVNAPGVTAVALSSVQLSVLTGGAIYTDTQVQFSADLAPDNASKPYTYTVDYGDGTDTIQDTSIADPLPLTHTFTATGTHLVQFSAWNVGMSQPITDSHTVTVVSPPPTCPRPLSGVALAGPVSGYTDITYTFTGSIQPVSPTQSVTLIWVPEPLSGQGTLTATYQWPDPGTYPITLTAENCGGMVTDTHTITITSPSPGCPHPLSDVAITGSTSGYTGTTYTFEGNLMPADATQPVTLTWTPASLSGQGTLTATYRWATLGTHTVTLRAENCGGVATATHGIAITPQPTSDDDYEPNDGCEQAKFIATTGRPQRHAFEQAEDEDWIAFHATAGFTYTIEARVPPTSTADLVLELYDTCPISQTFGDDNPAFNPDIRFNFTAPHSGIYYLRLSNYQADTFGPEAVYHIAVQPLQQMVPSGAVIVVAGKYRTGDPLQSNINGVSTRLYDYALSHGCMADQVTFLAADALPARTGPATLDALDAAITQWAPARVGPAAALTLYLMDHGHYDKVYLDGEAGEVLTPQLLNGWLDTLPADVPVNVIIEACYSGSFIDPEWRIGQAGRLVIASTSAEAIAYASDDGAVFSDAFLNALSQGLNLWTAFDEGAWAVGQLPKSSLTWRNQAPWLDDDGDGIANALSDGQIATERLFACEVAPPQENWPPHITQAEVRNLIQNQGDIWAAAHDDKNVAGMWAVVYPPSWRPEKPDEELIVPPKRILLPPGNEGYGGQYTFDEIGQYRIVLHAEDNENLLARPQELEVSIGGQSVGPEGDLTFDIPIGTLSVTVEVPASAITATTTFVYTPTTDTPDTSPPDYEFAGRGFQLTAYQYGQPQPSLVFEHPITFTVRYSDDDVEGLDEESLTLFYRGGDDWRTDGLTVTWHFTATNEVIVRVSHLTEFGLFGQERGYQVYLPLVLRE